MHSFAPKKSKGSNPMCRLVELQSLTFPLVKMDVFLKSNEAQRVHSLILDHGAIVGKEPIYSRWIHPSLTPASSEVFGSQASFCVTLLTRSCWLPSITSPGSTLRTPTANLILNSSLCKPFAGFPRWLFATVFVSKPVWWTNCFSTAQAFIVPPAKEAGRSAKVGGRIPEQTWRQSWVPRGSLAGVVELREEATCGRYCFSFELSSLFPSDIKI